ncbi:hypothetical protein MRX96_040405 [Rhipicephalus microplus]
MDVTRDQAALDSSGEAGALRDVTADGDQVFAEGSSSLPEASVSAAKLQSQVTGVASTLVKIANRRTAARRLRWKVTRCPSTIPCRRLQRLCQSPSRHRSPWTWPTMQRRLELPVKWNIGLTSLLVANASRVLSPRRQRVSHPLKTRVHSRKQ